MAKRKWNALASGAAIGVGASFAAILAANFLGRSRVIRLQKSIQVGRPLEDVFASWANFGHLVNSSPMIRSITRHGNRSHWVIEINGREIEWDAEVEQFIPNQAIGWKSLNGPKHTGRVSFSPLGNDTLIHVTMNYAPPGRLLRVSPLKEQLQQVFERVLRDFKATLEGKGRQDVASTGTTGTHFHTTESNRATGTFGAPVQAPPRGQSIRFGGPANPVEYTRPPEAKT